MRWDDLSIQEKKWHIPAKNRKRMHRDGALRRIAVTVAQHGGAGVDEIRAVNQHKITSDWYSADRVVPT